MPTAGGGEAYTQTDAAGLKAAFEEILAEVAPEADSTFVSPTVAVNAFNRTRTLNSLYVSVFAPSNRAHWPGNVKKYQLVDGVIHGGTAAEPTPAVNPATGFFSEGSSDMFPGGGADGADVTKGGAAVNLPAWGARKIYTYLGEDALNHDDNAFTVANTDNITADLLNVSAERRTDVIQFTLGKDVNDDDNDGVFDETRYAMGDPMHARPAVAIYGGEEDAPEGVVFNTNNDGMLQAIDMNSGAELWAFIPEEMMRRLGSLQRNAVVADRTYGLDGDVRIFKYDVDRDGVIEDGDKVYAVFGFGRGGSAYYALDVTNREAPRFLWKKTVDDLPVLGQAWSAPVITRVNVGTTVQSDPQKFVVIFGAGYDTVQEDYEYRDGWLGQWRLHAGARDRQSAVERGHQGFGRGLGTSVHEQFDPVRYHGARHERRQLCRPHVLRRHGRPTVASRHLARPAARQPGLRRLAGYPGRGSPGW